MLTALIALVPLSPFQALNTLAVGQAVPIGGVLAVSGVGIGYYDAGKWDSIDSMFAPEGHQKAKPATIRRLASGACYRLSLDRKIEKVARTLEFSKVEPMGETWMTKEIEGVDQFKEVVWFGSKPVAPKLTIVPNSSSVYTQAAKDFLKTKGFKNAKPVMNAIVLVDLDGNGTQEAVMTFTSRKRDEMSVTFAGNEDNKHPNDYCAFVIRSIQNGAIKTTEVSYTDGKKHGLDGVYELAGIWKLDGKPGAEIISSWIGYESSSSRIHKFANGRVKTVAEAGFGV